MVFTLVGILIIWGMLAVGAAMYQSDMKNNETTNIYNVTSLLYWNSSDWEAEEYNISGWPADQSKINSIRMRNVIYKIIDFVGFTLFEVSKWGIEVGYNNGDKIDVETVVDYMPIVTKWHVALIILSLVIPIFLITS